MELHIKPGNTSQVEELTELRNVLLSRSEDAALFKVSLEHTRGSDLAQFNALVALYVTLRRMNKTLVYEKCQDSRLKELAIKTNFDHVFEY